MALTLRIKRADDTELVIPNADWVAEAFFTLDPSSQPGCYDDWIASPEQRPDRITKLDIKAVNSSMRARSSPALWELDLNRPGAWLGNVSASWRLFELDEGVFEETAKPASARCVQHLIRHGRGVAVATKVLHIKRPDLIPVCDRLVVQQLRLPVPTTGQATAEIIGWIRQEGRSNLTELRSIQQHLDAAGLHRTLVRILDGLLWASHPATRMYPAIRLIERWRHGAG